MATTKSSIRIQQIETAGGIHDIDAKYWAGHDFSAVIDALHGVVDTYVINEGKNTGSIKTNYESIVNSTATTMSTTKTILDSLVDNEPTGGYKVGDIVLLEETDKFDRWVSKIDEDDIYLTILETQVGKHHHTITPTTASAVIGITSPSTRKLTAVGNSVSVVTSVVSNPLILTNVAYRENSGGYDIKLSTGTSSDHGHIHTMDPHSHTFTPSSLVTSTATVYTTLTSVNFTPHVHTVASVASVPISSTVIVYATGSAKNTASVIKTITSVSANTSAAQGDTGSKTGFNTNDVTNTITSSVYTMETGAHEHSVSVTTTDKVITGINLASKVITSVAVTHDVNVASKVMTSAKLNPISEPTITNWYCSVNNSGILSFTVSSSNRLSGVSLTTTSANQSADDISVTVASTLQTYTSASVSATGKAANSGVHKHGFGHTHSIPDHNHSLNSHTHIYHAAQSGGTATAITELDTSSYTPHVHVSVGVANDAEPQSQIKIITGGSTTEVVRSLSSGSYTINNSTVVSTHNQYLKIDATISCPALVLTSKYLSNMLHKEGITPAVEVDEYAVKSITITSGKFVTGIDKTNENTPGDGE